MPSLRRPRSNQEQCISGVEPWSSLLLGDTYVYVASACAINEAIKRQYCCDHHFDHISTSPSTTLSRSAPHPQATLIPPKPGVGRVDAGG